MELVTPKVNMLTNIFVSASLNSLIVKFLRVLLIVMGATGVLLVAKDLYLFSPTAIVIHTENLSSNQYNELDRIAQAYQPDNYFIANLPNIREALVDLDWVDQVSIQRDWQQGIVVTVVPRMAVAKFGSERLIDAQGNVYTPIDDSELNAMGLVTLQGSEQKSVLIMQHMQKVNELFAPSHIKVQDLILTPRTTWLIRFDNGLRVIVDNENTSQKLNHLSYLMTNQLRLVEDEIASVDLRYKNGFAITWKQKL